MFDNSSSRRAMLRVSAIGLAVAACDRPLPVSRAKRAQLRWTGARELAVDIVGYGATPAGVAAAWSAAAAGASVVLVGGWRDRHLGGMMAGGLGTTDFIDFDAFGSFPGRVLDHLHAISPDADPKNAGAFDPLHVPDYFRQVLRTAGVPFLRSRGAAELDVHDRSIRSLTTVGGGRVHGRFFIDASYEGDLLPLAQVSYDVGRGAASADNPLDGFRGPGSDNPQFAISPFNVDGESSSGLLPQVSHHRQSIGAADAKLQAYTFRLLMTDRAELGDALPAKAPNGYDRASYEPHFRRIAAMEKAGHRYGSAWSFGKNMIKADAVADGIYDVNSSGEFSTDAVGLNWNYPEAGYAERERIWKQHEAYVRGFFYALGWEKDQRLPDNLQREVRRWGLARDHFTDPFPGDAAGWPYQLYVREARRLDNGDQLSGAALALSDHAANYGERAVAIASYSQDSHIVQRLAVPSADGTWRLSHEGALYVDSGGQDYRSPLPYDIMAPHADQCMNLLVPFCVATSHQAFSSVRMEPTSMALGEAAGLAAAGDRD